MSQTPSRREQLFRERFGEIWPSHLAAFTRMLIVMRQDFRGDLDLLLLLAAVADRTDPGRWSERLEDPQRLLRKGAEVRDPPMLNAASLAHFTGIPRETVRRKLRVLAEYGWVMRDGRTGWRTGPRAAQDLKRSTEATVRYLTTVLGAGRDLPRKP